MNKLYAVVLLYNKAIKESITCQKIEQIQDDSIEVIILDNSTKILNNDKEAETLNYNYLSMNGNKGISIPYNKAVEYIINEKKASEEDFIIWFDDDTEITKEYFDVLKQSIKEYKDIDVFAPIIYGQDGVLYSPNHAKFIKNRLLTNEEEVNKIEKYNAINSCLAVKVDVYKNYRYDETLFLDQTDQNFFDDMRKLNKKFYTINTVIHQNFSQREKKLEPKKMLARYEIRVKDIMRYGRKKMTHNVMSLIKAVGLALQLGIKCKYPKLTFKCSFIAVNMFLGNIKNLVMRKQS